MRKKAKAIIKTVVIGVIVIAFAYMYSHIDKNHYIYDRHTESFNGIGVLEEDEKIKQTFVSEDKAIDGINIKITTVGDIEDVVLHYSLIDEETGDIVARKVAATELKNNKFNYLHIPTVENAEGKEYTVVLTAENSDEENGVSFYAVPGKQTDQELQVDEEKQDGTLAMRVICHRFDVETFVVSLGIVLFISVCMKTLYKSFR